MSKMDTLSSVQLGLVPTHLKFVGGLVPDEQGRLPRAEQGNILVVDNLQRLQQMSAMPIDCVQIPFFAGANESDVSDLVSGLQRLNLEVSFILMVGGADPMNPADEDQVVHQLIQGLKAADQFGIRAVGSTSIEQWMQPNSSPREEEAFEKAIEQNIVVHLRAIEEANVHRLESWHIEFLRQGEFQTFTNIGKCWQFVQAINNRLGKNFFKVLVDAAHCGDSDLSIPENIALIQTIAKAGALGFFHASAKTTRGCLSTDDGWIGALLTACASTGSLKTVFVEIFHHQDPALEGLRKIDARHGIDTSLGRTYDQMVVDALEEVGRRLNNLYLRGRLTGKV